MSMLDIFSALKGGPGSGNFGHKGRPGQRGGSAPRGSVVANANKNVAKSLELQEKYGATPKECWFNSVTLLSAVPGAEYVEGYFATEISPGFTFPIAHGWLELNGEILDVTLPKDKGNYYAAARFTLGDVSKKLAESDSVDLPITGRTPKMIEARAMAHNDAFGIDITALKGGPGSGHWGHAGRQGVRGGSSPASFAMSLRTGRTAKLRQQIARETGVTTQMMAAAAEAPPTTLSATFTMTDAENETVLWDYREGLPESHYDADLTYGAYTTDARGKAKNELVNKIATESGVPYDTVNKYIRSWADTSNDNHAKSLGLQKAASEEFKSAKLSKWQEEKISKGMKGAWWGDEMMTHNTAAGTEGKKVLRTMYKQTQERFAKAGIEKVTLYRGVKGKPSLKGIGAGDKAMLKSNAMESWTTDPMVARRFSSIKWEGSDGAVIKAEVPVSRIIGNARTGFGCLNEYEYVVLGGNESDVVLVTERGL